MGLLKDTATIEGRHDIQHNDIQHNDDTHYYDTQHNGSCAVMLSVIYDKCHYAECCK